MDHLLTATFEAHHAGKNHNRRYEVTVGRDLFDHWTVAVRYGRIGRRCQERRYVSPKPEEMRAVIRDRLRRRLSAPRRIGCSYRLAAFSQATSFDATDWLPNDVMAGFLPRHEIEDSCNKNRELV